MASGNDSDENNNFYAHWNPYSSGESDFEGFDIDDVPPDAPNRPTFRIDQSINDRENAQDVIFGWSREDSPPTVAPFTGTPGLTVELPDDPTVLDFFALLFDDDMWEILVTETNRYAEARMNNQCLKPFSRLRNWTDVSVDEMKMFIALTLAMGLVRKPDIPDYFTNEESFETPFFSKMMSRDRFLNILSNLHLVDNTANHNDRLYKIRPFVTMLRNNFLKYSPEENLAVDEGTCPFKGKILFRVYNPAKPNKFGIKLYQCCESSSGYIVSFDIYDGTPGCAMYAELVDADPDFTQTTKIVVGLLARSGLLDKGHKVYLDNYYNSPELASELDAHDTYMCGTVRSNRKKYAESISSNKITAR